MAAAETYINTHRLEIPKNQKIIRQFLGLERRRGRSGKDTIDHGPRSHDDWANAVAGLCHLLISSENSFFDGCDLSAEPVRVEEPNILHGNSEVRIRNVVAGLTLPAEHPGFITVIAVGKLDGIESLYLIHEIESWDSTRLLKRLAKAKKKIQHPDDLCPAQPVFRPFQP